MQVRMRLRLRVLVTGEQGHKQETREGWRGRDRNPGDDGEERGGECAFGGGQSPGESLGNRQNSKWVFEEVKAETRLVSPGGRGGVGEL